MNISGLLSSLSSPFSAKKSDKSENKALQQTETDINQLQEKGKETEENQTLLSAFLNDSRLKRGMFDLSPIERYNYISQQGILSRDPQEALKKANQVINEALLSSDNTTSNTLKQAMQIKRQAEKTINKSA